MIDRNKDYSKINTEIEERAKALHIADVTERLIEFGTWVQDNYSQNAKQGSKEMLPKGNMRLDFTDEVYTMTEIVDKFNAR